MNKYFRNYIELLKHPERVKVELVGAEKRVGSYCKPRLSLLDDFFREKPKPVDITILLYGGLEESFLLADYLGCNNLMFFRPKTSHRESDREQYFEGTPDNNRFLLLFDEAIDLGNSMREARDFFTKLGYDPRKIYAFSVRTAKQTQTQGVLFNIRDLDDFTL